MSFKFWWQQTLESPGFVPHLEAALALAVRAHVDFSLIHLHNNIRDAESESEISLSLSCGVRPQATSCWVNPSFWTSSVTD